MIAERITFGREFATKRAEWFGRILFKRNERCPRASVSWVFIRLLRAGDPCPHCGVSVQQARLHWRPTLGRPTFVCPGRTRDTKPLLH